MAACHDEADRFMAAFQSALKKDGVPERALADRLFTLAHRMLSATVEVDPSGTQLCQQSVSETSVSILSSLLNTLLRRNYVAGLQADWSLDWK